MMPFISDINSNFQPPISIGEAIMCSARWHQLRQQSQQQSSAGHRMLSLRIQTHFAYKFQNYLSSRNV
ncbi:hypothetical protein ACLKA7_015511 [Drosophila subpalustris]